MKVIGVTGSFGCGKSTVSAFFSEKGAVRIDADVIAHELSRPGKKLYGVIVDAFGKEVLTDDGEIDRKKLSDIVFNDRSALAKLCDITHPVIISKIAEKIDHIRLEREGVCILIEAPLLVEAGMLDMVDAVVVVKADERCQIERLMSAKNMSKDEIIARINSQMSQKEKIEYANYVVDNSGSREATLLQVEEIWRKINEK